MGATPHHLQKIYDAEAAIQRPIILGERDKNIVVTKNNWVQYFENPRYRRHPREPCYLTYHL